jgi:hypothetical protein
VLPTRREVYGESTTNALPPGVWHAYADADLVVGGTGRLRWVLIVRCPLCGGRKHVNHARVLEDVVRRKAACGRGWLLLHPIRRERER